MGIVSELLLLPFSGPVHGFRFFLERIRDEAEAVMYDEGRAFAELIDLSMRHNTGELSDAEFTEQQTVILEHINSIRDDCDELRAAEAEMDEESVFDAEPDMDEESVFDDESKMDEESVFAADPDMVEEEW